MAVVVVVVVAVVVVAVMVVVPVVAVAVVVVAVVVVVVVAVVVVVVVAVVVVVVMAVVVVVVAVVVVVLVATSMNVSLVPFVSPMRRSIRCGSSHSFLYTCQFDLISFRWMVLKNTKCKCVLVVQRKSEVTPLEWSDIHSDFRRIAVNARDV
jgi:hypothetical protein